MTRRGAFDAALVVSVGIGWGLLAPATKALFLATPAAFDGISVAVARAVWAFPIFLIAAAVLLLRERPHLSRGGGWQSWAAALRSASASRSCFRWRPRTRRSRTFRF